MADQPTARAKTCIATLPITELQPNIIKWFDRDVWTRAVNDAGYTVARR